LNNTGGKNRMILDTGKAYMSSNSSEQTQSLSSEELIKGMFNNLESFAAQSQK